jgi:hypothetical protein
MELIIRGSFFRDWDNLSGRALSKAIAEKTDEIRAAADVSHISHLKKLRTRNIWYKIELKSQRKVYWILCVIHKDKIEFVRLKPESFFKKNL